MEPLHSTDPEAIGPYRLLARLGAGGMGQVYLARSAGGRTVAVKVVRPELAQDHEFRARFRREVAAAQAVDGAYTAPVTDADPDAPAPWLATAYVLGPSLTDAVREHGPLPEPSVRALGARLAEALEAIHRAGLIHRDLKPSNVLLAADGPRVIDFGIARAMDGDSMTQTGTVVGSPGFMSPEQASGRPTGAPGDVFSLASVLVFAATGHGPFDSSSGVAAQLYKVVHEEPDLTGVPPALRTVLEYCLRKDPGLRPPPAHLRAWLSAGAPVGEWLPAPVAAALARHAAAVMDMEAPTRTPSAPPAPYTPTQVGHPGALVPPTTPAPRPSGLSRRRLFLAGGGLVAAAVGGTGWALTRPDNPGRRSQADSGGSSPSPTPASSSAKPDLMPAPKPAWSFTTQSKDPVDHAPFVAGGVLFVDSPGLTALDPATGAVRWHQNYDDTRYLLGGGELYGTLQMELVRIAPANGEKVIPPPHPFGQGEMYMPKRVLAASDQGVFVAVMAERPGNNRIGVLAFKAGLGPQLWFQEDPDMEGVTSPGRISGTTLLYLDRKMGLVARSTSDGRRLWRVGTGNEVKIPFGVWCDEERAYTMYDGYDLQAVRLTDGTQLWNVKHQGDRFGIPLAAQGTVYASDGSPSITAFDAASGGPRWTCQLPGLPRWDSAAVLANGTLFVPSQSGTDGVHAVDAGTGKLKWTFKDPDYSSSVTGENWRLSTNGTLIFACLKNKVFALPAA
ncbi:PQQ-binding-like beta-propeller repeat protein [Kitasatospora sp. NPDC050467]|uniref:serine/threonine-protein kinase n=1 Tax=Kitasatospora sp. NPDC050467 TaxID=3364053 RepID=UPI0037B4455D